MLTLNQFIRHASVLNTPALNSALCAMYILLNHEGITLDHTGAKTQN